MLLLWLKLSIGVHVCMPQVLAAMDHARVENHRISEAWMQRDTLTAIRISMTHALELLASVDVRARLCVQCLT